LLKYHHTKFGNGNSHGVNRLLGKRTNIRLHNNKQTQNLKRDQLAMLTNNEMNVTRTCCW